MSLYINYMRQRRDSSSRQISFHQLLLHSETRQSNRYTQLKMADTASDATADRCKLNATLSSSILDKQELLSFYQQWSDKYDEVFKHCCSAVHSHSWLHAYVGAYNKTRVKLSTSPSQPVCCVILNVVAYPKIGWYTHSRSMLSGFSMTKWTNRCTSSVNRQFSVVSSHTKL